MRITPFPQGEGLHGFGAKKMWGSAPFLVLSETAGAQAHSSGNSRVSGAKRQHLMCLAGHPPVMPKLGARRTES
jgi:hypothetical protein